MKGHWILSFFWAYRRWLCKFYASSVNLVYHIGEISCVGTSLQSTDKLNVDTMSDFFNVTLNLFDSVLLWAFQSVFIRDILLSLCFNNVFLALALRPISYQFGRLCSFLVFAWVWERLTFNLIFKFSKNSSVKPSGLGLSFFERFSSIDSICFLVTGLLRCSVSPLWSHGGLYLYLVLVVCMLQEFIHFPFRLPNVLMHIGML